MRRIGGLILVPAILASLPLAGQEVPTPVSHFGFEIGADRTLANWDQLSSYYGELAEKSPRISLDTLGLTTAGLPFLMVTVTSPENHARLDRLHDIQMRLADPRRIRGESELESLLEEGRTVVLITHGIHATEVGGPQMAARLLHRMATSDDPAVLKILDEVIFLDIPSLNPDGLQWVVEWYNRWVGTEFEGAPLPWLYHYYVGHDNNRDWYAFTQVETELTVTGAHNAWHPHIVHDIHQMGGTGARIFFPPYVDPFEPNVDPGLIAAGNQLGAYMAAELTAEGMPGAVINAQYDGFTPARAYQHYHGGVRILSETASVRIATPVNYGPEDLQGRRGFDANRPSWNFPWPWAGGDWRLGDIVDYMEAGAFALLTNAARNRPYWLRNFYEINRRAVEGWDEWPDAWIIPADQENAAGLSSVLRILTLGDVEVRPALQGFRSGDIDYPAGTLVVPMRQPYASFAQTMLEVQVYPDLRQYPGGPPIQPYDVTAHTLPLLMGVDAVPSRGPVAVPLGNPITVPEVDFELPAALAGGDAPRIGLYKSWREPIPEGWTRWVFDRHALAYDTLHDADIQAGDLEDRYDVIVFQGQSASAITDGWDPDVLPAPYAGGLGEDGVRAVRDFVRNGGRLVAIEEATDFAVDLFDLSVTNLVDRLPSEEFFIPGSILALDVDPEFAAAAGMDTEVAGWYWEDSRAFDVGDPTIKILARYGQGNALLSGWALGLGQVAGMPAALDASVGRGSVVLFGFQPNYRAQTIATWPMLFEALDYRH